MLIVNKPDNLNQVKCYKCETFFYVHPMQCMNSPFITNCDLHKKDSPLPIDNGHIEAITEPA